MVPFKLNLTQPEILTRDLDELYHRRRDERRLAAVPTKALPVKAPTPTKSLTDFFIDDLNADTNYTALVHVPVFDLDEDDYDPFASVGIKRVA
ncbi:hypothetical protein D9M69_639400 [compost metagenome]